MDEEVDKAKVQMQRCDAGFAMPPRQAVSKSCYGKERSRGGTCCFSGRVELIHGVSAENLRSRLARVSADLLRWAAEAHPAESAEDT